MYFLILQIYIMEGSVTRQFLAKALVSKESSKVFLS